MKPLTFLKAFDFVGNRNIAFLLSIVVIVVGLGSIVAKGGVRWGIDFAGGTLMEIQFQEIQEIENIRRALNEAGEDNTLIQRFGEGNVVLIRLQHTLSEENLSQDARSRDAVEKILGALEKNFGAGRFEMLRLEEIGPQIGSEMRESAELAILFTFAGLVLYISWRFESKFALSVALIAVVTVGLSSWNALPAQEWMFPILIGIATIAILGVCIAFDYPFAFAAIVALIHDVLVTVGFLSLTNREITLTVVAALLTIIGYSINDTIVVFDRIRENLHLMRHSTAYDMLNASIQQTMSRTLLTAFTTLMVVVVLWIGGGRVINSFAFALFVGLVAGTYSSIFVATPILFVWNTMTKGKIFKRT